MTQKENAAIKKQQVKIKICRLATVPFYVTNHLKSQVEYLRDQRMDVTLISSYGPEINEIDLGPGLEYKEVEIARLINPWKDILTLIKLIKIFKESKFDIIHSTTPKAGLLASVAGYIVNVPIRLHTWTGQPWVTLKGIKRRVIMLADKLIGRLCSKCYADSPSQREFLINEKIISSWKIKVINKGSISGVDIQRFDPERFSTAQKGKLKRNLELSEESKIITFIGRMNKDKGIKELISAFKKIVKGKYDCDLLLIGPLDQDSEGDGFIDLDEVIKDCPRIHYLGYQNNPEAYLSITDIFCLPSYREGFGTTVIEAAAMGVPTIGTKINGLVDAIQDDKTGLLVPLHNIQALENGFKQLLDNPDKLEKLGRFARKRCVENFDKKLIDEMILKEYLSLLHTDKIK